MDVVYSAGNLKLCAPEEESRGSVPALGITFQERVSVTFWWFLWEGYGEFDDEKGAMKIKLPSSEQVQ